MQQQMNRKAVPEGMGTDWKRRTPYSFYQGMNVPIHGLPAHGKDPVTGAEVIRIQVTLNTVFQGMIDDRPFAREALPVDGHRLDGKRRYRILRRIEQALRARKPVI